MEILLRIDGEGLVAREVSLDELNRLSAGASGANGVAGGSRQLLVADVLRLICPPSTARYAIFHTRDGYSMALPISLAATQTMVYVPDEAPRETGDGAGLRLRYGDPHPCWSLKLVHRIELSSVERENLPPCKQRPARPR
jgi:hypothetical protein